MLNYHRVNDYLPADELVTSTETFRRQMEYLHKKKYEVIGIDELAGEFNRKKVLITFDDGYLDNHQNAFPILKHFGFKAVIFLTCGYVNTDNKMKRYKDVPWKRDFLNQDEIRIMAENGIEFGAHTVNHVRLAQIPLADAKREIYESKRIVGLLSGREPKAFCYPYGDYNEDIKRIVEDAGFQCAFTVTPGCNTGSIDRFELKRTGMNGIDTLFDFKKKLAGAYDSLHIAIQKSKKIGIYAKKPRKINILYIIWALGLGGAERAVISLAKGLDKARFNPVICCLNWPGEFACEVELENIKVVSLNKKPGVDLAVINKLINVIRENKIDIVHTHLWGANFWGRIAAKVARVPVIIATEHSTPSFKSLFKKFADRVLAKFTDKIIAVSEEVKNSNSKEIGIKEEKFEVIYNGVDTSSRPQAAGHKQQLKHLLGINNDEIIISCIGRLSPEKGHRYLFEAMGLLNGKYKVKLLVVGDGLEKQRLGDSVKGLGIEEKIIFTGMRKDIREILGITDVLVSASLREGMPITALEAMACRVPVIATNVGGTHEVVQDAKTGILVEAKSPKSLVEATKRLLDNSALAKQMGKKGYERVSTMFSLDAMVDKHQRLYEMCLAGVTIN